MGGGPRLHSACSTAPSTPIPAPIPTRRAAHVRAGVQHARLAIQTAGKMAGVSEKLKAGPSQVYAKLPTTTAGAMDFPAVIQVVILVHKTTATGAAGRSQTATETNTAPVVGSSSWTTVSATWASARPRPRPTPNATPATQPKTVTFSRPAAGDKEPKSSKSSSEVDGRYAHNIFYFYFCEPRTPKVMDISYL